MPCGQPPIRTGLSLPLTSLFMSHLDTSAALFVALAMDPDRARWNKQSVSSGQLASEYGFKDLDGSQPDIWRYMKEFHELGLNVNPNDYR